MTQRIQLATQQFVAPAEKEPSFAKLIASCIQEKRGLVLVVNSGGVSIGAGEKRSNIILSGETCFSEATLTGSVRFPAALVAPIALRLTQIYLPACALKNADASKGTIAAFFSRSLFFYIVSGKQILFESWSCQREQFEASDEFRRQYWYILKHYNPDPALMSLPQHDALAQILINCVLPLANLGTPLMRGATAAFRARLSPKGRRIADIAFRLSSARDNLMAAKGLQG